MNARRVLLRLALAVAAPLAAAYQVPHSCAERTPRVDGVTPVPELRHRIEALGEDDPFAALDLLCGNLPRVAREYGPQSLELARWEQAIATPLIAYLSRFDEAEALLAHARPILARRLGAQAPELAEIHVAYAWMTFKRGRVAESAEEWSAALAIRERHAGPKQIELQKVLTGLAQARLAQRQTPRPKRRPRAPTGSCATTARAAAKRQGHCSTCAPISLSSRSTSPRPAATPSSRCGWRARCSPAAAPGSR